MTIPCKSDRIRRCMVIFISLTIFVLATKCDHINLPPTPPRYLSRDGLPLLGPVVKTQNGHIMGNTMSTRFGRSFYSFRGVPYAEPPLGHLRFKAPKPAKNWPGILNANNDTKDCTQKNYLLPGYPVSGSEDCLYLNVYTHHISTKDIFPAKYNPVMVYIHGGGFFAGSGALAFNGPEFFLDNDVVLVTINYRLGALGFLSTGDEAASGNWGLKDQVLALRWVQANIKGFGGDPNNVTIFGQSAGAASVHYHILSQLSKGLFHRAISESGSALNLFARPMEPLSIARKQAEFVECPINVDTTQLVECLRSVDAHTLTQSGDGFKFWSIDPLTVYSPVIETKSLGNKKPFLQDDPLDLINSGKIANRVPWILGVVSREGVIRATPIISNTEERNDLNKKFDQLGPKLFELTKSVSTPSAASELWNNITNFYLDSTHEINNKTSDGFIDMYSDRGFMYGIYQSALLHSKVGHNPIYFYHLTYRGVYSWSTLFSGTTTDFGVSHCDDLIHLFRVPLLFPDLKLTHEDVRFSRMLVDLWTNFATYGDPTPGNYTEVDTKWLSIPKITGSKPTNSDLYFLNIAKNTKLLNNQSEQVANLTMRNDFYTERMNFWANLPIAENTNSSILRLVS